ncbi:putative disease resistance protein RGA3 [Syzygium oleosum]|uniref:putative disease resistance protein RGA3 n=1 Tax=Syzygium oleosum TaxID=219896 RepID=UPI0024BAD472|nr:putative disease resistance protein RGA3 [Syzygium oleosum]
MKKWEKMLISINQVLDDAEDRQLTGHLGVKLWLEDLKNLAYDIEDLLDEFATESVENKSKAKPGTSKARSLLPSCCLKLSSRAFMFDRKMRSAIEEMDDRLKDVITRKDTLNLRENKGNRLAYPRQDEPHTTTHLPEPGFVSRENEKREILDLLTGEHDDRTCVDLKVIPIVGMGGVGKTALAQQVYNDARVTGYFDAKAWACVSDNFDMLAITERILETTSGNLSCEDKDLNWLQDKLKENLSGKKFLVVLDDVWNEKYGNWTALLKPFQSGAKGSKIIVTTRNKGVASVAGASPYYLKELSEDACVTLFAFHALQVENFDSHPHLEELGRKIVEKCKGLPLAAKTLAGLLRGKYDPQYWKNILKSQIWDLPEERNEILPALKLSYLHLPSNLRRCFAYCAIFPKDYEIERDELIRLWSAEGFLEGKEGKNRWNAGLNYFDELVSRSLFQKSSSNNSRFLMHDLVNDLAKLVASATYFSSKEFESEGDQSNAFLARHASFICSNRIVPQRLKIYHGMERLRSFISIEKSRYYDRSYLSKKVLCDLLSGLKYLRVLSLSHYYIKEVPDCIGKLRHLRFLNLSYTDIETLPKSIVALNTLEVLILQGCQNITELPEGMEKLINLKCLDISDTSSLRATPLYIGNLVDLEMLSKFIVGIENGSRLKELKNLNNLERELCIFDLHKVREAGDAKDANLCMKEGICQLNMQWCNDFENFRDEELEAEVLDFLCPHQNLANLEISYYGGLEFPSWLGSPSYVNIVHLRLQGCRRAKALPSLVPHLEKLVIRDCPMLIGRFPSQLSSLKKLEINSCPSMDASLSTTSLPSLKKLKLAGCNKGVLESLVNLTSLTDLVIEVDDLTYLNHGFTSSLIKLEKLEMQCCHKLRYLWQDSDVIRDLACLKSLLVNKCPEFLSFAAGEGEIQLPGNFEIIGLRHCDNLEKLPSKMHTLSSLRDLTVLDCPKLVSFPETGISTSVTSLAIMKCEMLQSLPRGLRIHSDEPSSGGNTRIDMTSCLQELRINGCHSLPASSFGEDRFLPVTLKTLEIRLCNGVESFAEINVDRFQSLQTVVIMDCENLRSLPQGLHTLSHLTSLTLGKCPALELECFPPLPISISSFSLESSPKITSLPNQLHRLPCLRDFEISECESITRFPDGGLPPQLQELTVMRCGNMKQPVREWLTPLTSLEMLIIDGSVGGLGEEEDLWLPLPSSLLRLGIVDMQNAERPSSSFPPSLRTLWIVGCPKLRELPLDGLPPSLEVLWIRECGILEERCKKGTGRYWPLIREIPQVRFTGDPPRSIT